MKLTRPRYLRRARTAAILVLLSSVVCAGLIAKPAHAATVLATCSGSSALVVGEPFSSGGCGVDLTAVQSGLAGTISVTATITPESDLTGSVSAYYCKQIFVPNFENFCTELERATVIDGIRVQSPTDVHTSTSFSPGDGNPLFVVEPTETHWTCTSVPPFDSPVCFGPTVNSAQGHYSGSLLGP